MEYFAWQTDILVLMTKNCLENRIFVGNCQDKSKFLRYLSGKNRNFSTRILRPPLISTQIDAAAFAHTSTKQSRAFSVVGHRPGTASLLNFVLFLEPCNLRFLTLGLRLPFLAVLELGAPLSNILEEVL